MFIRPESNPRKISIGGGSLISAFIGLRDTGVRWLAPNEMCCKFIASPDPRA
jgi:hypothetical protein